VNDFEKPIHAFYPILQEIKLQLSESGAILSLMSGSGSTMYGVFTDKSIALSAQTTFERFQTLLIPIRLDGNRSSEEL
jgi:4-diphosphocytidyl-2-C-methyl-D-erythritol kinase